MNTFTDAQLAREFILAGNAIFTLRSRKTGAHYTYRVRKLTDKELWFSSVLTAPNEYTYMGVIEGEQFRLTKKSSYTEDTLPVRGLRYALRGVFSGTVPGDLDIMHEGRCGRCCRPLTRPDSIERGLGPECAGIIDRAA